jgi:hypothetical protein
MMRSLSQPLFLFSHHKVVAHENESKNKLTYTLFVCVVVSMLLLLLLLDELIFILLLFDAAAADA